MVKDEVCHFSAISLIAQIIASVMANIMVVSKLVFQTLPLSLTSYRYFDWPSYRCSSISSQSGGVTGNEAVLIILVITALLETINQGKEQSSVIFTITSSESQKHLLQHYYSN